MEGNTRGVFLFEHESVIMKKWQILEFDGKPYYAFVPENETPIDTENIPIAESPQRIDVDNNNSTDSKFQITQEDEHSDPPVGDDASFYNYEHNENEILDGDSDYDHVNNDNINTNNVKPSLMNGMVYEGETYTHGDLYQVEVEGNVVTIEKLAENINSNFKLIHKNTSIKVNDSQEYEEHNNDEEVDEQQCEDERLETEDTAEMLENVLIEEDDQHTHEIQQYIDGDSMESLETEYLKDNDEDNDNDNEEEEGEEEEQVDKEAEEEEDDIQLEDEEEMYDVEAIEEKTVQSSSPTHLQNQRQTRYRSILPNASVALKCKACSETFGSSIAFRKHVAWTHKKKVCIQDNGAYICAVCDYRTLKKSLFAAHLERKHETWPRKGHNNLVFPCAVCGFVCRSKHSLQSHFIRKHTDKYEHQCKFCPKKFKVKGDLTNHVRFHHKEKPINCDVCGKLCQNTGSLYVHKKWAHYKPKYECVICKRRMVTQENLTQHMVTQHEKREKIVCAECGKTFTKKDSFKRHMAVHTGSKPHHCPICNKPFARQSQLRQHVLIHTGKRPFVCDICGKAFTQKPGLICHRKTHPGPLAPLPVMPIADMIREFTEGFFQNSAQIDEIEEGSE